MEKIYNKYLIINASLVTNERVAQIFEFVLNDNLRIIECGKIESISKLIIKRVEDYKDNMVNHLFEINHVRVNPRLDNDEILQKFRETLAASGVEIYDAPQISDMKILYNPVGELSTIVRFYMDEKQDTTFLAPTIKLKLV